jgi:hypothetical protein
MANSLHRAYDLDIIAPSGSTKVLVVTEDEFQFAYATIDAIQTPLDVAGLATDADITSLSASIAALSGSIGVSGSYSTQDKFFATNNGGGQNFKIGDDVWIGDVNVSNTMQVSGAQNSGSGYIKFGSGAGTPVIGTTGANHLNIANIPSYVSNAAALSGGLVAGDIYRNGDNICITH